MSEFAVLMHSLHIFLQAYYCAITGKLSLYVVNVILANGIVISYNLSVYLKRVDCPFFFGGMHMCIRS